MASGTAWQGSSTDRGGRPRVGAPGRWSRTRGHASLVLGAALVLAPAVGAILAPWVSPYGYEEQRFNDTGRRRFPHPFGTDDLGRDLLSRVLFGARVTLILGVVVVAISGVFGLGAGALSGYAGGWADELLMRATEVVMAFPSIVLAMTIVVALGPGIDHGGPRDGPRVVAALRPAGPGGGAGRQGHGVRRGGGGGGAGPGRILGRHVLPNVVPRLLAPAAMDVGAAIVAGAGLSFLGLGPAPPTPEAGAMVSEGIGLPTAWWVAPIWLVILGSVLGFNFLGDGARDLVDPRMRLRWGNSGAGREPCEKGDRR